MSKDQTVKKSRTSPKGGKRGCLCEDSTYSKDCCKGELINQGVGALTGGHISIKTRIERS